MTVTPSRPPMTSMRQRSARVTDSSAATMACERHAELERRRDGREGVHDVVLAEDARTARGADSPVGERAR